MQNRILLRSLLLLLMTTCLTLALQNQERTNKNAIHKLDSSQKSRDLMVRDRRQAQRKPGFFKTLFQVAYEQWGDTKNTIQSVNKMLNENFLPENAPQVVETTTISSDPNATTTKMPYKIKRSEFNKIIQRNLRGLVRLFNIELQDALKQSDRNYADFRKNATLEVSKFL